MMGPERKWRGSIKFQFLRRAENTWGLKIFQFFKGRTSMGAVADGCVYAAF